MPSPAIYGWLFHTQLLGAEAELSAMMDGLAAILDTIPRNDDPTADAKCAGVSEAIQEFVARFP